MERTPEEIRRAAQAATRCANFNLRKASRSVGQVYDAALRPLGLKGTQFSLLTALALTGPVTLTRLAEELVMDRTSLTRNLQPLIRRGYVGETRGDDRRQRILDLTDAGLEAYEAALPVWQETQARIEARLGAERLDRMLADLALATKE